MMQLVLKQIGPYTYDEQVCLGEGAYGKVYKGNDTRTNGKVAIKRLDLVIFEKDRYLRQQIVQEIEIMQKFNHPNIVKFIELLTTRKSLYIVTEMCKDGDLKQLLSRKRLEQGEVLQIMIQLVNGFREMVKNGVIHRDLKPANILNHNGIVKVGGIAFVATPSQDFGFAKYVDNYTQQLLKSCVGSPLYMAPQILQKQTYSTKCDIWSLGIIYYEMLYGRVPWHGRDEDDLLKNILTKKVNMPPSITIQPFASNFITKSLVIDEKERLTWDQVFSMFDEVERSLNPTPADGTFISTMIEVPIINFEGDVNEEEEVQKVPTWMNRALNNKSKISKEQVNANLLVANQKREYLAFCHFVNIELFSVFRNDVQFMPDVVALLSRYVVQESILLIQMISDTCDGGESHLEKGIKWRILSRIKHEHAYYEQAASQISETLSDPQSIILEEVTAILQLWQSQLLFEEEQPDPNRLSIQLIDTLKLFLKTYEQHKQDLIEWYRALNYAIDLLKALQETKCNFQSSELSEDPIILANDTINRLNQLNC